MDVSRKMKYTRFIAGIAHRTHTPQWHVKLVIAGLIYELALLLEKDDDVRIPDLGHFFRRDLRIKIASGKGTSIRYNPDDIVRKKKHYRTPFLKFAPKFKRIAASLIWEEE
jgi:nucleoid DNA-binding protein